MSCNQRVLLGVESTDMVSTLPSSSSGTCSPFQPALSFSKEVSLSQDVVKPLKVTGGQSTGLTDEGLLLGQSMTQFLTAEHVDVRYNTYPSKRVLAGAAESVDVSQGAGDVHEDVAPGAQGSLPRYLQIQEKQSSAAAVADKVSPGKVVAGEVGSGTKEISTCDVSVNTGAAEIPEEVCSGVVQVTKEVCQIVAELAEKVSLVQTQVSIEGNQGELCELTKQSALIQHAPGYITGYCNQFPQDIQENLDTKRYILQKKALVDYWVLSGRMWTGQVEDADIQNPEDIKIQRSDDCTCTNGTCSDCMEVYIFRSTATSTAPPSIEYDPSQQDMDEDELDELDEASTLKRPLSQDHPDIRAPGDWKRLLLSNYLAGETIRAKATNKARYLQVYHWVMSLGQKVWTGPSVDATDVEVDRSSSIWNAGCPLSEGTCEDCLVEEIFGVDSDSGSVEQDEQIRNTGGKKEEEEKQMEVQEEEEQEDNSSSTSSGWSSVDYPQTFSPRINAKRKIDDLSDDESYDGDLHHSKLRKVTLEDGTDIMVNRYQDKLYQIRHQIARPETPEFSGDEESYRQAWTQVGMDNVEEAAKIFKLSGSGYNLNMPSKQKRKLKS